MPIVRWECFKSDVPRSDAGSKRCRWGLQVGRTCEVGCACRIMAQVRVLAVAISHQPIAHDVGQTKIRSHSLMEGCGRQATRRNYDDVHSAMRLLQVGRATMRTPGRRPWAWPASDVYSAFGSLQDGRVRWDVGAGSWPGSECSPSPSCIKI
ncbi:hypothetical protein DFP72DRAFT_395389 [Ephemerocybe angulata]|uniref:Uncharacterized protein n=1 Tax=Ephemerocybe angulata TaxID=980116 RepID=A0A8H6M441_9AGAR|nr:hypothetical protein DFP72DRAFT_395389 [Tulosesus angulatus]